MQVTFKQTKYPSLAESPKKTDEQLLLRQIARGDRPAFWQLWQRYQDYLYRRCWTWMGGNSTDAQEALSRAMLKAWNKLPKYAEKITNIKAWLTRMTHNLCVDIHRERQRGAKSIESIDTVADRENEAVICGYDSPESAVLRREMQAYIRQAVNALPARLHQPFILRFDREMSYPEIAKQLAISPDNVRKRIQQAREILQKQLDRYFSGSSNINWETSQVDEISTANAPTTIENIVQSIDYRITASCLKMLPPTWYSLSSPLEWN